MTVRTIVLGGTGLLGLHTAEELARRGHAVTLVSRHPLTDPDLRARFPYPHAALDVAAASPGALRAVIAGHDTLVYAVGPDERDPYPEPAAGYLRTQMVRPTAAALRAARDTGVRAAAVLGSYFTAWHRAHPELRFAHRHPYVTARVLQSRAALALADDSFAVSVLEIPYVFGVLPGRPGPFKDLVFDRVRRQPVIAYPSGGSAVVSAQQVGDAAVGALERRARGSIPLADENWCWDRLLHAVADGFGLRRRVVHVPRPLAEPAAARLGARIRRRGGHPGIDPRHLMRDIMYRRMYLDTDVAHDLLGMRRGGVREALHESLRSLYPDRRA